MECIAQPRMLRNWLALPSRRAAPGVCRRVFVHSSRENQVRVARREAAQALRDWGLDDEDLEYAVRLIVSELAGNVVRHAADNSPTFRVSVGMDDTAVHVEVRDRHPRHPVLPAAPHADGEGGYGLRLVFDIAAGYRGSGKVVPTADGGKAVRVRLARSAAA
jgi:anti-sigma regulatory factor (Ser/Thr protein kinase)